MLLAALVVAGAVFRHQEDLVAAPAGGERFAHHLLAAAVVIIPRVVEERHPVVDRLVHDRDGLRLGDRADVPPAESDDRYFLARLAQRPLGHSVRTAFLARKDREIRRGQRQRGCGRLEKLPPIGFDHGGHLCELSGKDVDEHSQTASGKPRRNSACSVSDGKRFHHRKQTARDQGPCRFASSSSSSSSPPRAAQAG